MRKIDVPLAFTACAVSVVVAAIFITAPVGPADKNPKATADQKANHWPIPLDWLASSAFWTAIFTGALTWSTVRLWRETRRLAEGAEAQSSDMKVSIAAATKAANAADRSATAAIALELPILYAMPPQLLAVEEHPDWRPTIQPKVLTEGRPERRSYVGHTTITNIGRTPAVFTQYEIGLHVGQTLPPIPVYTRTIAANGNTAKGNMKAGEESIAIGFGSEFAFSDDQIDRIVSGEHTLWFFAKLHYLDFMSEPHAIGLCWHYEFFRSPAKPPFPTRAYFNPEYSAPEAYICKS